MSHAASCVAGIYRPINLFVHKIVTILAFVLFRKTPPLPNPMQVLDRGIPGLFRGYWVRSIAVQGVVLTSGTLPEIHTRDAVCHSAHIPFLSLLMLLTIQTFSFVSPPL
jgi:hypothetical protein